MGMDAGGPSAMGMYANAGGQGTPPDTGMAMGRGLVDAELAARQRYAEPAMGPVGSTKPAAGTDANYVPPPDYYNYETALPVKYNTPSAFKERLNTREAVRQAAGASLPDNKVIRTDPITEEEVNYLQAMQDQAELADFDRYVNSLIDVRKPGNLKWLMEIYPDFVNRRIQQVHTDYEYALRGQMIDSWGINTFEDLHFKYLQDQGKIKGPHLANTATPGDQYSAGILAPSKFKRVRQDGVRLPFASAKIGKGANKENEWVMPDGDATSGGQPLAGNRGLRAMANSMYASSAAVANEANRSSAQTTRMFPR